MRMIDNRFGAAGACSVEGTTRRRVHCLVVRSPYQALSGAILGVCYTAITWPIVENDVLWGFLNLPSYWLLICAEIVFDQFGYIAPIMSKTTLLATSAVVNAIIFAAICAFANVTLPGVWAIFRSESKNAADRAPRWTPTIGGYLLGSTVLALAFTARTLESTAAAYWFYGVTVFAIGIPSCFLGLFLLFTACFVDIYTRVRPSPSLGDKLIAVAVVLALAVASLASGAVFVVELSLKLFPIPLPDGGGMLELLIFTCGTLLIGIVQTAVRVRWVWLNLDAVALGGIAQRWRGRVVMLLWISAAAVVVRGGVEIWSRLT